MMLEHHLLKKKSENKIIFSNNVDHVIVRIIVHVYVVDLVTVIECVKKVIENQTKKIVSLIYNKTNCVCLRSLRAYSDQYI